MLNRLTWSHSRTQIENDYSQKQNSKNNSTVPRHALATSTHCADVSAVAPIYNEMQKKAHFDPPVFVHSVFVLIRFLSLYLLSLVDYSSMIADRPKELNKHSLAAQTIRGLNPFPIQSQSTLNGRRWETVYDRPTTQSSAQRNWINVKILCCVRCWLFEWYGVVRECACACIHHIVRETLLWSVSGRIIIDSTWNEQKSDRMRIAFIIIFYISQLSEPNIWLNTCMRSYHHHYHH